MNRLLLLVAVAAVYVLHQDLWFWREARPLIFGFLPVGLAYHGLYCLLVAGLMWWLTRTAWPAHLDPGEHAPSATAPGAFADPSPSSRRTTHREGGRR